LQQIFGKNFSLLEGSVMPTIKSNDDEFLKKEFSLKLGGKAIMIIMGLLYEIPAKISMPVITELQSQLPEESGLFLGD
jgi:hypothetical protein